MRDAIIDGKNPRDVKFELGVELVSRFHGEAASKKVVDNFVSRFQKNEMPEEMESFTLQSDEPMGIAHILKQARLVGSTSEAIRMIQQGAVKIDGEKVENPKLTVPLGGAEHIYQVGKRKFARICIVRTVS